MKFSQAAQGFSYYLMSGSYSRATIDLYAWALSRLSSFLGDPEVSDISTEDLRHFMAWLRTGYVPSRKSGSIEPLSSSSRENAWKAIRSFFRWAALDLGISRPDLQLSRPRATYPEIIPYSQDEIQRLLKACEFTTPSQGKKEPYKMKRPTARRDRALVFTLLDTGVRASECARIQVQDVNLSTGEVFIRPYGSGRKTKSRSVFLGKVARRSIFVYLAGRDTGNLFLTHTMKPMDRNSIRLVLSALGVRAGVHNTHPHRFRHTFAIQYLRNGGDVFTLQRQLGHSSLEMVRKYLTLADSDSAAAHLQSSPVDRWQL